MRIGFTRNISGSRRSANQKRRRAVPEKTGPSPDLEPLDSGISKRRPVRFNAAERHLDAE
jgi:hypothetical protein